MRLSRKIFCLALLVGSALLPPASATCLWFQCFTSGENFLCCNTFTICENKAQNC
jgi:hypothetical protein